MKKKGTLIGEQGITWSNQITNIRALAILLVVFGHSIILYSSSWSLYSSIHSVPLLDNIKRIIDIIQMPIFFSISGYLFFYTHNKKRGILWLIKNKFKRLIVPYFLIGFIYMVPIKYAVGYSGYYDRTLIAIIGDFLMGQDVGHLWFLPALFFIFLICEIFINIIEKVPIIQKRDIGTVVLLILAIILYYEGYRIAFGYAPILSAFANVIWFAFGYFICTYHEFFQSFFNRKIIKIASAIIGVFLLLFCAFFDTGVTVGICCKLICILVLYVIVPGKNNKIISCISKDSFGIYLFHSPLIYITFSFWANESVLIVVLLNFVIFGGVALFITEFIRRKGLGLVIGE